jgi:hypothetical protein
LDHKSKTKKWETCSTEEFFTRLIRHISDKYFRLITYYGFLSNHLRGQLLPAVYEELGELPKSVETLYWHQMFKASFGTDPMRCILWQPNEIGRYCPGDSSLEALSKSLGSISSETDSMRPYPQSVC